MKKRICFIMDMGRKKAGAAVLCGALVLTLGTGFAFAASAKAQGAGADSKGPVAVSPWIAVGGFVPDPGVYAPYAAFVIAVSEDGSQLLYQGQPVRQFSDEQADGQAFYFDETGIGNLSAVRDAAGALTGIKQVSAQKAQETFEAFFAEELDPRFPAGIHDESARALAAETVREKVWEGGDKYEEYRPFGLAHSEADGALTFDGQRVKSFIDWPSGEGAGALWTDGAGTVNLAAVRDAAGRLTGLALISEETAREYRAAAQEAMQKSLNGLAERVEARGKAFDPER